MTFPRERHQAVSLAAFPRNACRPASAWRAGGGWARVPKLGVANPTSNLGGPRGRRFGHPRHRTVRTRRRLVEGLPRAGTRASRGRLRTEDHRCRVDHSGGDAGPRRAAERGPLAALRPRRPAPPISLSAQPAGLQQAAARPDRHDRLADQHAGPRYQPVHRRRLDRGLHAGRMRPLPADGAPSGSGRWGGVRLRPQPLPLLLGPAAAPAVHRGRPAGRLRADRGESRRARDSPRHPGHRPGTDPPAARADRDRGQELLRPRVRGGPGRRRDDFAAPGPQGRARPAGNAVLQTPPAGDRVDQRHLQGPTRPRTTRRAYPPRSLRPRPATHPGPHRSHLAQRPHRRPRRPLPHHLRSLTPGIGHLGSGGLSTDPSGVLVSTPPSPEAQPRVFGPIRVPAGTTAQQALKDAGPPLKGPDGAVVVRDLATGALKDLAWAPEAEAEVEPVAAASVEGRAVIRHSTAHVLAQAVQDLFPGTRLGIGPPVENGFYYDFDTERPFTPEDLTALEKKMQEIVRAGQYFSRREISDEDAATELAHEPYKLELIGLKGGAGEAAEGADVEVGGAQLTMYDNRDARTGDLVWTDLCRGPHLPRTSSIPAFSLTRSAAAYWRGSEKNPPPQRIYGTPRGSREAHQAHPQHPAAAQRSGP